MRHANRQVSGRGEDRLTDVFSLRTFVTMRYFRPVNEL